MNDVTLHCLVIARNPTFHGSHGCRVGGTLVNGQRRTVPIVPTVTVLLYFVIARASR